ncbi:TPA: hypothetical protein ACGXMZ_005101 [Bacillus albus]
MVKSLSIDDMKQLATEKGGWCLSEVYINQLTKLTWKCSEGHVWETIPKHIRKGSWCPICARKSENRKSYGNINLDDLKQIARDKGGECLSDTYINKSTKIKFKCNEGHTFETRPAEILRGHWCSYCAGKHKNSIEKMHEIAKERKGKCLSTSYKNVFTKLKWECANGHEFESIPKHVINGHWCPNCTIYLNEQRCRYILEKLFDKKFVKDHSVLNGFELDGYNKELQLAFEYHGKQHYEHVEFFYSRGDMSLEYRKERDKLKENLCKKLGIELLVIPYTINPEDYVSFIANELSKRGFKFKIDPSYISFDNYSFTNQHLKELQDIAKSKGGKCLSKVYINIDSKLEFICENGHYFSITPYNIKKGQWCRKCSYEKMSELFRLNENEMHNIAKEKGWICLSNNYKNAREKLKWKCEEGHIFERSLSHVKEGRGCPTCNKRKR